MKLFYTGAKAPEEVQINGELSLGGYKSSSTIPNGALGSLFPTIVKEHLTQGKVDVRMIVLKNTTSSTVNNLKIWSECLNYSKVKLAVVEPALDSKCNIEYFEAIDNGNSLPYQADFQPYEGQLNANVIGALDAGKMLGIWILREADLSKFTDEEKNSTSNSQVDCENCITTLQNDTSTQQIDEIKVYFDWN